MAPSGTRTGFRLTEVTLITPLLASKAATQAKIPEIPKHLWRFVMRVPTLELIGASANSICLTIRKNKGFNKSECGIFATKNPSFALQAPQERIPAPLATDGRILPVPWNHHYRVVQR
jgi:hypothetical protein